MLPNSVPAHSWPTLPVPITPRESWVLVDQLPPRVGWLHHYKDPSWTRYPCQGPAWGCGGGGLPCPMSKSPSPCKLWHILPQSSNMCSCRTKAFPPPTPPGPPTRRPGPSHQFLTRILPCFKKYLKIMQTLETNFNTVIGIVKCYERHMNDT